MEDFTWWKHGIVYQIYPRSYYDSNHDGFGDIPGILSRLDYLANLGIDAIWLSPVYPTPDADFGYDISNYVDIDPRFGSMQDFDQLVQEAHQRNIRIILDLVLNHTSDQHLWFKESRSSKDNPRRDWYIWRDPAPNGKAPNNWQASFGGQTWTFDPRTKQYYLHLFTTNQPDLNWRNPNVRKALLDTFRFWLERGVDGFRLDVFNAYFKHPDLLDNPSKFGLRAFDRQQHINDIDQPEMLPLLQEIRALVDQYPERYLVGETYQATPQKLISYCAPDKLHAAFSFDFTAFGMKRPWSPAWVQQQVEKREQILNAAQIWPTTVFNNHDLERSATRYSRGEEDGMTKIVMALLLTLRGTPYLYQGEEIGMRDIQLKRREILDPPGRKFWPFYKGRDGCRSPMQWDDNPQAGFTQGKPWLPVHPNYRTRNVAVQEQSPDSVLNFTRQLIQLRKRTSALFQGNYIAHPVQKDVLLYERRDQENRILVCLNFSARSQKITLPNDWQNTSATILLADPALAASTDKTILLAAHQVLILSASNW